MDRTKMLKVLGPAAAAGALVLLVGVLIALNDMPASNTKKSVEPQQGTPSSQVAFDDSGMSDSLPPLDSPEWKPAAGGMRMWDAKEGTGEPCKPGANVIIHYTGWLKNGTVFDSSRTRGEPADFRLGNLIRGWQEGIPGMKPGGIRRLEIPPDWAYGRQARDSIPANSTLVFEVKLLQAQ